MVLEIEIYTEDDVEERVKENQTVLSRGSIKVSSPNFLLLERYAVSSINLCPYVINYFSVF